MKRLFYILVSCATVFGSVAHAQQFRWGINGGSIDAGPLALTERVSNMASDPNGNLYVTSPVYRNNISVAGANLPDGHDYQFTDILLTSLNCNGSHRWSKIIGGIPGDDAPFVKVSPLGQVYLAGYVTKNNAQPIDFGTDTTLSAAGFQTLFLIQYDTLGHKKWLRMLQSDTVTNWSFSRTQLMDMDIDAQGNVYMLCKFPPNSALGGTSLTIPPGPGIGGMYVIKYSGQGTMQSVTKLDMSFNNTGANTMYLRRHPSTGNYYVNGMLVPFVPYNDTLYLGTNRINTMAYVSCYSPTGQLLWYKQNAYTAGLNNTLIQNSVQVDAQGDIYVAGQGAHGDSFNGFSFTNPLGSSVADVVPFVMKMNPLGVAQWTSYGYANPYSLTTKMTVSDTKVAVGGSYAGLMVWNGDSIRNSPLNGQDGWFAILNKLTGTIEHLDSIPGPSTYDGVTAVHYHNADLFLGGYLQTNIKVGSHTIYSNGGSSDFFVAKYGYLCNCTPPAASFTKQGTGLAYQFTSTATGQIDSLRWYFGDGQTSTVNNPSHTYANGGGYPVSLVVHNSCGKDSTTQVVQVTVGLQQLAATFPGLVMYPNPVQDNLFIDRVLEGMQLQCYNVSGQLVLQQALQAGRNSINTATLQQGMYLITLKHPDGRMASERIIKL